MVRFTTIGGWLLALALVTAACGARPQEPLSSAVSAAKSTVVSTSEPLPRSIPPTAEKASGVEATPPPLPGAASGSGSPAPAATPFGLEPLRAKPAPVSAGTVEEPDGAGPRVLGAGESTAEQQALLASLPDGGQAPELENEVWLNSAPLRLADLRGKVVVLDMWTFG